MTSLDAGVRAPSFGRCRAGTVCRSWETSHLRPLSQAEIDAVTAVMPAWLHSREWHPPEGADIPLLWEYADRHGLGGALGALAAAGLAPPGELAELAKHRYFSNMIHSERASGTCRKIFAAARALDLPVVNFKGPALAAQAYGDPGVRTFSDLDLWARSRADALRLLTALGATVTSSDRDGLVRRLRDPAAVLGTLDGWDIEVRYPAGEATDPMLDLLSRCAFGVPQPEVDCFGAPDPSWHLLLLVLHMSWYHYYSRFVWFLDLAALVSRCRRQMDFDWILQESRRLCAANLIGVAGRYCREHIDPSFPAFPLNPAAWNYRFISLASDSRTITRGKFSLHQRTLGRRTYILWFRIMRFFLLSDPPVRYLADRPPESWMIATVLRGFRSDGHLMRLAARGIVGLLVHPLARLSAWISTMDMPGGR